MNITIICSDVQHPVRPHLVAWMERNQGQHAINLVERPSQLGSGDILFAISCSEILRPAHRALFRHALVIHASDLPRRRGWSPHIWAIIDGERDITVSLLTADDPVDSGLIFHQTRFSVEPHDTLAEINAKLFATEMELMDWALACIDSTAPRDQIGEPSFCRKRTPSDSRLDPEASLASQFDTLRLADPVRFPAFFDLHGHRFALAITCMGPTADEDR